ncbi:MAG: carbohydrate kinase [Acidobacteriota bacterium]
MSRNEVPSIDVVCLGEFLLDFVPAESGHRLSESKFLRMAAGGAPANVAVAGRRLGLRTGFIGKTGSDPFGRYLREMLERSGVDTTCFTSTGRAATRLAFVTNDPDESQRFLFYGSPPADSLLRRQDVPPSYLQRCRVLHVGSISMIQEPARTATLAAVRRARKIGILVSFDPNLRPALWPSLTRARREIDRMLELCDILKVSQAEWEFLFGRNSYRKRLAELQRRGVRLVAITSGDRGSLLASGGNLEQIKSLPVRAVDTTGAGDAYVAGLLYGVLRFADGDPTVDGEGIRRIGRFASVVAGLSTTQLGAIPGFPSLAKVKRVLG